jgi:methionyl-tRNA formyltransferase
MTTAVLAQMEKGPVEGVKQDKSLVTKAPKLTKEHGLIDWTRPAEAICSHVRAMQPWPTAYTFWHRSRQPPMRLLLTRATARPATETESEFHSGDILVLPDLTRLSVRAGEGVVEVLELQPAGKKKMSAADFLRGRHPQIGDRLGPEAS